MRTRSRTISRLRLRARGRYHVHRESEIALGDMPDILASAVGAPVEVAIELKHGGKNWTAAQLDEALHQQLAEDYLKPGNRRHGIFIVTNHRMRRWRHPATRQWMVFAELTAWLSQTAASLIENSTGAISVHVRGIDVQPTC